MNTSSDLRHGRSCVFQLHVHLVFVARYRRKIFSPAHYVSMGEIFAKVCADFGAVLVETDGEKDHVHLLVNYPPTVSVSKLVNSLKGVSSRLLRKTPGDRAALLEGWPVVPFLLRRFLRRGADLRH